MINLLKNIYRKYYVKRQEEKIISSQIDADSKSYISNYESIRKNISDPELVGLLNKCVLLSQRYSKIVIWGLKNELHTHRYIHKSFFETLQKLKIPSVWLDDTVENNKLINKSDLVFAMNHAVANIIYRHDVFYCLHNVANRPNNGSYLNLQVFNNDAFKITNLEELEASTFFHREDRTLYQSWGTDLLPGEFLEPVFNSASEKVYWVGSIWDTEHKHGNAEIIEVLKAILRKHDLEFIHKENVSLSDNIQYMRESRIAPAIGGGYQVKVDYLPCRFYKNISYGCLGISNIEYFNRYNFMLKNATNISALVGQSLTLDKETYLSCVREQQRYVELNHTYVSKLIMIFESLNKLY